LPNSFEISNKNRGIFMATAENASSTQDKSFFGHPAGLSTLFFTEMWERFSYYGIRPLLVLFMAAAMMDGGFGYERGQASAIVGIYGAGVYLASLPGGWVADRLLGLRKAILYGAIFITAGHFSIGVSAFAGGQTAFFLGLLLIVIGTGLLKHWRLCRFSRNRLSGRTSRLALGIRRGGRRDAHRSADLCCAGEKHARRHRNGTDQTSRSGYSGKA
jgi:hypothetical protein